MSDTYGGEKVLMEGTTNLVTGIVVKNGHGVLTSERFIYGKHSLSKIAVMGAITYFTRGSYEYDILLNDIASATVDRFRLGHALTITKTDGTVYKYGIGRPHEWQLAFDNALKNRKSRTEMNGTGQTTSKRFCSSCGAKLEGDARFCSSCGAKVY